MNELHPDYVGLRHIADTVIARAGGQRQLEERFPIFLREVIDSIVDPMRTGRTRLDELVNVEKTFIGLRLEHVLRDMLDVPSGVRDLVLDGLDVDVKNTVLDDWTIPPESYRNEEPCILLRSNEATLRCWMGVVYAREAYLRPGRNRDTKRALSAQGKTNILWILDGLPYPPSHWTIIDANLFRNLRRNIRGGTERACAFFRGHLGLKIHRSVIQALLFDQRDYMKRIRGNGGARDHLAEEGIALLSGTYDAPLALELGYGLLAPDEVLALEPQDAAQAARLRGLGRIA